VHKLAFLLESVHNCVKQRGKKDLVPGIVDSDEFTSYLKIFFSFFFVLTLCFPGEGGPGNPDFGREVSKA
jgi:hypothetical protein